MKEAFENTEMNPREKLKVTKADIIVTGTKKKPYFEIKYKEVGKENYNIGFGSYDLNNVFNWREEEMEIVSEVEAEYGNDWIPCSERLPDNDDDVLCWYEYSMLQGVNVVRKAKTHGIGHYYKPTDSWLIYGGFGMGWNVIAWQPLPEPYKPIG